jgi:hypothetical protein
LESALWEPENEHLRAGLYRQFTMNLSQGYFLYFHGDPKHPQWVPFENSAFLAQPNPDSVYHYTAVDGAGVYRISGQRATVPVMGFATAKNCIGMAEPPGPGYDNYDADDLSLGAGGDFEFILSTQRPNGYQGDWRYLNPEAQFVIARQFSYNWGREVDGRFAIERLDVAPPRPAMTATDTDRLLKELFGQYVRGLSGVALGYMKALREREHSDQVVLTDFDDIGNSGSWPQAYYECMFALEPDEALILETELPEQHVYWNVQVIDALWNQVDLVYRQTSLNGHQAVVDADNVFRAVLSTVDPGIPNWLDNGGNRRGMLIGRWYRCSSHPIPTVRKVKLNEVRQNLPRNTPTVSAEEREEMLRARAIGAQLRRRW